MTVSGNSQFIFKSLRFKTTFKPNIILNNASMIEKNST